MIIVLLAGSALDIGPDGDHAKAIIQAWYPGAKGGEAVADLILGKYCPSGKLPVTFYRGDQRLPDFKDYTMQGRTYRFLEEAPLYPFGFGLSYTTFQYKDLRVPNWRPKQELKACVTVKNTGSVSGAEVVQAYVKIEEPGLRTPCYQMVGMDRLELEPGQETTIELRIDDYWLQVVTGDGRRVLPTGSVTLYVGGHQPDAYSTMLTGSDCLSVNIGR